MSYSKMKWFEDLENFYNPYYYSNNSYEENNATEEYVDVKFNNSDYIYTYISPNDEIIHINDKYLIKGKDSDEEVIIVSEPYITSVKYDHDYKVLPIIKKINNSDFQMKESLNNNCLIDGIYIAKYETSKHKHYLDLASYSGGYTSEHFEKLQQNNPNDTYIIYDIFNNDTILLGCFGLIKPNNNEEKVKLAISLSVEYLPQYLTLQDAYEFLAKYIHAIYDFLKKYYNIGTEKYAIILNDAGPYGNESHMLGVLNASKITKVVFKYKLNYWEYGFKKESEINI